MAKKRRVYATTEFNSVRDFVNDAAVTLPDQDAFLFRKPGAKDEVVHVTNYEFNELTENLGAALTDMGYGDAHIAIISENSFDWISAYVTVLKSAGVFVPVDKELVTADKLNIINGSDSTVLFFSAPYERWVHENLQNMPNVKTCIGFSVEEDDGCILSYSKLLEKGAELDRTAYDSLASDPDDLKYLVYTSGTTGIAKGVMLTERNICSVLYYGLQVTCIYEKGLSVLPYHHTYESVLDVLGHLYCHRPLCINNSLKNIVKDLQLYKPTHIFIVPALAEFLYASIKRNIRSQGKEKSFDGAVKLSNALRKVGIDLRPKLFKSLHEVFGGNMVKIICGGAPIRPEIGEFFDQIGIYLVGGYGITECSPLVSVNDESCITYDTVGSRLSCLEWRIDDPNEDGEGEICVKSPTVMKGYYKQPDKTAEVIIDDWFYTGDYGYINKDDQLVITGRKKNIIVLNNGKNVYPEEIENYIQNLDAVEEVVVRGIKNEAGEEVSLKAEVYLGDHEIDEQELLHQIQKALSVLPPYKNVTQVEIRTEPFPKTSTVKIKRNA